MYIGQKVRVYLNLNKGHSIFSIADAHSGLVLGHSPKVTLKDVKYHVNEAGRQRVLRDKRKSVHAWVTGELVCFDEDRQTRMSIPVYYNPYRVSEFINCDTKEAIHSSYDAHLEDRMVWISQRSRREGGRA